MTASACQRATPHSQRSDLAETIEQFGCPFHGLSTSGRHRRSSSERELEAKLDDGDSRMTMHIAIPGQLARHMADPGGAV